MFSSCCLTGREASLIATHPGWQGTVENPEHDAIPEDPASPRADPFGMTQRASLLSAVEKQKTNA
ncbi:hypothetical protein [Curvibacter gracilis]|uniref:hypothetical protein n=1 Tax=Curvibacter gracilis TaxID=230310 RepID=UPI0012F80513|nr:hypothetical protein [Curvibacter gracilis]